MLIDLLTGIQKLQYIEQMDQKIYVKVNAFLICCMFLIQY